MFKVDASRPERLDPHLRWLLLDIPPEPTEDPDAGCCRTERRAVTSYRERAVIGRDQVGTIPAKFTNIKYKIRAWGRSYFRDICPDGGLQRFLRWAVYTALAAGCVAIVVRIINLMQ